MSKLSSADNDNRAPSESGSCCGDINGPPETLLFRNGSDLLDITCDSSFASVCEDGEVVMTMAPQNTSTSTDAFQNFMLCGFDTQEQELEELQQRSMLMNTSAHQLSLPQLQGQEQARQKHSSTLSTHSSSDPCQVATMPRFLWQSSTASASPEDAGLCCNPTDLETSHVKELYTDEDDIFSFVDDDDDHQDGGEEALQHVLDDGNKPLLPPGDEHERSSCGSSCTSNATSDDDFDEELDVFPNTGGTVEDPQYVPRPSSTTPSLREMSQMFRTASLCDDDDHLSRQPVWQNKAKAKPTYVFGDGGNHQPTLPQDSSYHSSSSSSPSKKLGTFGGAASKFLEKKASPLRNRFAHRRTRSEEKSLPSSANNMSVDDSDSGICLTPVIGTSMEPVGMPRARTADYLNSSTRSVGSNFSNASTTITEGGGGERSSGKKGKNNPMMKLLRRTRLPSLRKQNNHKGREKSSLQTPSPTRVTETPNNSVIGEPRGVDGADVVDILASLELTLRTRSEETGREKHLPMPRIDGSISPTKNRQSSRRKPSPTDPDPPSLQLSGETQSCDSSSIDDVFSGVLSDDNETETGTDGTEENDTDSRGSSESSSEDSRSTVDRFLSSPYSSNQQGNNHWSNETAVSTPHGSTKRYPYHNQEVSRLGSSETSRSTSNYYNKHPYHHNGHRQDSRLGSGQRVNSASMLASPSDFIRCSSVDTTKASNLHGSGNDRARLLDLQAFLWQQQKQEIDRLNAPPIDFEAPDGDGVIRVREAVCETIDAACEIEVLPKLERFHREPIPETSQLPPTAAEF